MKIQREDAEHAKSLEDNEQKIDTRSDCDIGFIAAGSVNT